jgi:glycosyltransferase involved in cell wall biosynthesis
LTISHSSPAFFYSMGRWHLNRIASPDDSTTLVQFSPLKVLFDAYSFAVRRSGVQFAAVSLIEALSRRPEVELAVLLRHREDGADLPSSVHRFTESRRVPGSPLPWGLAPRALLEQFDVVHCVSVLPPFLRKPRGPKVVMTLHDVVALARPQFVDWRMRGFFRLALPQVLRKVDVVHTDSEFSRQEISHHLKIDQERIVVVPLALRWPVETGAGQKREKIVLAVGNLEPRKNIGRAIEAFAAVRAADPELRMLIVGKPSTGHGALTREWVGQGVEWLGYVDDERLRQLYRTATVLLFPSLHEGFGLPVIEAMSQGCPVICSNAASLPEVAGDAALYVDPLDVGSMANALKKLINDHATREQLTWKGRERAAEFSGETMTTAMLRVYSDPVARLAL